MLIFLFIASDGKCCFIKLWSSLELFGFEFLSCSEAKSNKKGLIGISKDKVRVLAKVCSDHSYEFYVDTVFE